MRSLIFLLLLSFNTQAFVLYSFEEGQIVDGMEGIYDGLGDKMFIGTASYFTSDYLVTGEREIEGQAIAYFDLDNSVLPDDYNVIFNWEVKQTSSSGLMAYNTPDSTSIFFMNDDSSGLSIDDFNKGSLIVNVDTSDYGPGGIISANITEYIKNLDSNYFGIRLSSNNPISSRNFINLKAYSASINISEVPLPAGIYLFLSGLVGLGLMRGRNG